MNNLGLKLDLIKVNANHNHYRIQWYSCQIFIIYSDNVLTTCKIWRKPDGNNFQHQNGCCRRSKFINSMKSSEFRQTINILTLLIILKRTWSVLIILILSFTLVESFQGEKETRQKRSSTSSIRQTIWIRNTTSFTEFFFSFVLSVANWKLTIDVCNKKCK